MAPPLLLLQDIHLTFGGTPLLDGANLSVSERERLCLVGRNGSGKSTLLKIAAGSIQADSGRRFLQPGTTMRYLPQEPDLSAFSTVIDYAASGLPPGEDPYMARLILEGLGMTGEEDPRHLSGGEARRAALAWALAPDPDILLLDEPTNHLDLPTIEWLEDTLAGSRAAIVLISHDRRFLERLSRTTLWLDRGETRLLDRNFAQFETWRDEFLEQEEQDRHKMDRKLAREQDWIVHGVSGRRKRNQGRLRALQDLRQERRELRQSVGTVNLQTVAANMSGKQVIEAKDVSKSYDGRPIVRNFSTRILRGDRVGIIGANGAGKTTLLKMLTGALAPDTGTIKIGAAVELVSLDQQRTTLDPAISLSAALTGGNSDNVVIDGKPRHVISYMRDFLFTPEQAKTAVGRLSGGERGRLMLARALSRPSNLLVLDEPTNDLDLETLDLLQEMLTDYSGTVLLVSHDRDFIDRVVTSVIVSEGTGRWAEYAGGYSDMLAQQGPGIATAQGAAKADRPAGSGGAKPRAPSNANAGKSAGGLSFKDRDLLGKLPGKIAALQKTIAGLQADLADPALFRKDRAKFDTLSAALTTKTTELETAEEQWLNLEMKREAAGG
jgi:ATP-binding cassette subfamily F protein uup